MRELHILAGTLALLAGAIALFARKGSPLHRYAGRVFALAMLVMAGSALVSSVVLRPHTVNTIAATLVIYLVVTAWLTLTHSVAAARAAVLGLLAIALATGIAGIVVGVDAMGRAGGLIDGIPAPVALVFGGVALLGAALDLRMLVAGSIVGTARSMRHQWRMSLALWLATASFFLGQAQFVPEPVRRIELLLLPVLIVALVAVNALLRTWWRGRRRGPQPTQSL